MNILVITNYNHQAIGGIETFCNLLYKNFNDISFTELCFMENDFHGTIYKNVESYDFYKTKSYFIKNRLFGIFYNWIPLMITRRKNVRKVNKIVKEKMIDKIIINHEGFFSRSFFKKHKEKIVFVQHMHPMWYIPRYFYDNVNKAWKKKNIFSFILTKLIYPRFDFYKYSKNIAFVDSESSKMISNFYNLNNKNIFIFHFPSRFEGINRAINTDKNNYFISPIRNEERKNPNKIMEVEKNIKRNGIIIGSGYDYTKNQYTKIINSKGIKSNILDYYLSSKFLFIFSDHEGFSIVSSEALSLGLPLILPNSYPTAYYLVGNNNERGLIFDIKSPIQDISNQIENFINNIDYNEVSKNCIEFYNEELSLKSFIKSWNDILHKKD